MRTFNGEKLRRLHLDQAAGWRTLRDLSSASEFQRDCIADLERELAGDPVTREGRDYERLGKKFQADVLRRHAALEKKLAASRQSKAEIDSEIARIKGEQEARGQLLQACIEYLRARGCDPALPDVRPHQVGRRHADIVI